MIYVYMGGWVGGTYHLATCCPIRPQPTTAKVLPASSVPMNLERSLCRVGGWVGG